MHDEHYHIHGTNTMHRASVIMHRYARAMRVALWVAKCKHHAWSINCEVHMALLTTMQRTAVPSKTLGNVNEGRVNEASMTIIAMVM